MNRFFTFSALAFGFLIIMACASQPAGQNVPTPAGAPVTVAVKDGERIPASNMDFDWVPVSVDVKVAPGSSSVSASVDVVQKITWTTQEPFPDVHYDWQDVYAPDVCYTMACKEGVGKSRLWTAYFEAKKENKAKALADAIDQLSPASAEKLIKAGYFKSKPESWEKFSEDIQHAGEIGLIPKSTATKVTITKRLQNAENLGYAVTSCHEQSYSCNTWQNKLVPVPFTNYRPVHHEKSGLIRHFDLNIQIANSVLMSNESDLLSLEVNENGDVTGTTLLGRYNRYNLSSTRGADGRLYVSLVGVQRIPKDLGSNTLRADNLLKVGGIPTFVLDVDPVSLPNAEDPNSQLVLNYAVKSCDLNWMGTCKWTGSDSVVKIASFPVTADRTVIPVNEKNLSGKKIWIEYTLSRKNSRFYNETPTYTRATDKLKI